MADISVLMRIQNGFNRGINVGNNTLVTTSVKVGGNVSNTELTKAILDNLVALQNGTDFPTGVNAHTHDARYFLKTELTDAVGPSTGSDLIGDDNTYTNFTPTTATVKGALAGIDAALTASGGANTTLSNLGVTAVNSDLNPGADDTLIVGDMSGNVWAAISASSNNGKVFNIWSDDRTTIIAQLAGDAISSPLFSEITLLHVNDSPTPNTHGIGIGTSNKTSTDNSRSIIARSGTVEDGTSGSLNLSTGLASLSGSSGFVAVSSGQVEDGTSGGVTIASGGANTMGGLSGDVTVATGNTTDGLSGTLVLRSGAVTSGTANSGNVILETGTSFGGIPGEVIVTSPRLRPFDDNNTQLGADTNQWFAVYTRRLAAGLGGSTSDDLDILTLPAANTLPSGAVTITTGDTTNANSGPIILHTGTATPGTRGKIKLQDGTEGTVGWVWTQTNADGSGAWMASGGGGGANTALSNLITTSINQSLLPDSDVARNFGSATLKWDQSFTYTANAYGYNLKDWPIGNVQFGRLGPNGSINGIQGAVTLISELTPNGTSPAYGLALAVASTNPTKGLYVATSNQAVNVTTGNVDITSGGTSGTGLSGDVNVMSGSNGTGTGDTGLVRLISGNANGGNTGSAQITTGNATGGASGSSGSINFTTGTSAIGNSGNIFMTTGTAGATRGKIKLQDGTQGTVGHVWTQSVSDGTGSWQAASGGGANTALSNLITTSINQDLLPDSNLARNVGSSSLNWASVWTGLVKSLGGMNVQSEDFASGATSSAQVQFLSGNISGTGTGGSGQVNIRSGTISSSSALDTGIVNIGSGNTTSGNAASDSGQVLFQSGTASAGNSGLVTIRSGNSTSGLAGNINITVGTSSGTRLIVMSADRVEPLSDNVTRLGFDNKRYQEIYGTNIIATTSGGSGVAMKGSQILPSTGATVRAFTHHSTADVVVLSENVAGAISRAIFVESGNVTSGVFTSGTIALKTGNSASGASGNLSLVTGTAGTTRGSVEVDALEMNMNSTPIKEVPEAVAANAGYAVNTDYVQHRSGTWRRYRVNYTYFTAAATSETKNLFTLGAGESVEEVVVKHAASFTGGTASNSMVEIGKTGTNNAYASSFGVFAAPSGGGFLRAVDQIIELFDATTQVTITLNVTGDNVNNLTAGAVDVWVKTVQFSLFAADVTLS